MAVAKYHEIMKPLLDLLGDGRKYKIQTLYADLVEYFKLTAADKADNNL